MTNDLKFRHEFKYQCNIAQAEIIKQRAHSIMDIDKHSAESGYCVRSLYFDNYANKCFFENENGTDCREKYRLRIYNADPSRISLECKRKEHGKTHKTSCLIDMEQYYNLTQCQNLNIAPDNNRLLNKFIYLIKTQHMKPAVIVEYDRIPFVYPHGNVRVTLDMNIRSSDMLDSFFDKTLPTRPILPSGQHLLEVKYDEFLPSFIKEVLMLENLNQTTFSKYYLCRKFSFGGKTL